MQVEYFKKRSQMAPVRVPHYAHRQRLDHINNLDRTQHHNTIRVVIKNQKNAEAFALMIPDASA